MRYIGARYVPLILGEWDSTKSYEPLSVVVYQGNSYTSKKNVPVGVDIANTAYWVQTGNYNQQIEQMYTEWQNYHDEMDDYVAELIENGWESLYAVTPQMFGAKGDGVTDDTQAIQMAINSVKNLPSFLSETTGKVVFFPMGEYLITDTLNLTDNCGVSLVGEGHTKSNLILDVNSASKIAVNINGNNYRGMIKGMRITPSALGIQHDITLINITGSGNQIDIEDCWINNAGKGINANPLGDCKFINNIFEFCDTPLYCNNCQDIIISNNMFYDCGPVGSGAGPFDPSYHFINSKRINFYANKIVVDLALSYQPQGMYNFDTCNNCIFANNIENADIKSVATELKITDSENIMVKDNIFGKSYQYTIELTKSKEISVIGNSFEGTKVPTTYSSIICSVQMNGVIISNNIFKSRTDGWDLICATGAGLILSQNMYYKGFSIDASYTDVVNVNNLQLSA